MDTKELGDHMASWHPRHQHSVEVLTCSLRSIATAVAHSRAKHKRQREAKMKDANFLNERLLCTVLDGGGVSNWQ